MAEFALAILLFCMVGMSRLNRKSHERFNKSCKQHEELHAIIKKWEVNYAEMKGNFERAMSLYENERKKNLMEARP